MFQPGDRVKYYCHHNHQDIVGTVLYVLRLGMSTPEVWAMWERPNGLVNKGWMPEPLVTLVAKKRVARNLPAWF